MAFTDQEVKIQFTVDANGAVKGVSEVDKALGSVGDSAIKANQALELAEKGFQALRAIVTNTFDALDQGAKINDVSESFARLSAQAGSTSDVFLTQLKTATAETIDNFTLMKSANEALKANLTPEQFTTVAEAARLFAKETGTDTVEQMNSLSRALATGREQFLKLNGVVIDSAKAAEDFRRKYNLVGDLNEKGQLLANQEAALTVLKDKLKQAGDQAVDTGDAFEQLQTAWNNIVQQFQTQIGTSEELKQSLSQLREVIKGFDFSALATGLVKVTSLVLDASSAVIDAVKNFRQLAKLSGSFLMDAANPISGFQNLTKAIMEMDLADKIGVAKSVMDSLSGSIAKVGDNLLNSISHPTDEINKSLDEQKKKLEGVIKVTGDHDNQLGAQKQRQQELEDLQRLELRNLEDKADLLKQIEQNDRDLFEIEQKAMRERNQSLANWASVGISAIQQAAGGDTKGAIRSIGSAGGAAIATATLGPEFAAVGAQLGDVLGKAVFDGFNHIFGGGNNADTKARKQVDKWLSEIFDKEKLRVIIGGNLTDVFDFDFGGSKGFNAPDWSALFSELPTDAQRAFDAVGISIKGLQGISEDVAGQIAFVFSQNLGGSLNNLQIALGTLGLTAEQMGAQVISAFERGEISALQAQSALLGIQQVAQVGIPDGIGMVAEAFDHLTAAGAKGGRVTLDALVDIAAEAKELGINTIPELQAKFQEFVAAGKISQEQVTEFFNALAQNSIGNVDALLNASKDTLIAISSSLQQSGLLKEIEGVVQAILQLPDEKTVRVNVETRFTGDKAAADAIGLGNSVGSSPGVA